MKFTKIGFRNFRNISEQFVNLHSGLNVLRGMNGQGKTNFVEAIYLLTHGRSFRTNDLTGLIQKNGVPGFFLTSEMKKGDFNYRINLGVSGRQKKIVINDKPVSTPHLQRHFSSVLFSPESLLIVKDSPQRRRELIDDLCVTLFPNFSQLNTDFKHLLAQKNNLLKKLRDKEIDSSQGHALNKHLTDQLFAKAAYITLYRLQAIEEIEPFLLQEFLQIMDNHYGNVSIRYEMSDEFIAKTTYENLLNAMYKRWSELRDREVAAGLSLVGPHKHDIHFCFNKQEARFFCSQGQQRAIILAFKMAQTRLHYRAHKEFPILLLDDVLSELDKEKQLRFVKYLLSTEAQIFLTTTDATALPEIAERVVYEVKEGRFSESKIWFQEDLSV